MSVETDPVLRVAPVEQPRAERRRHRKLSRLGAVGLVIAAALGFLIFKTVTSAVVYFKTADQALIARHALGNSTFQIEGLVVKGSIHKAADGSVSGFVISSGKSSVRIDNEAPEPALFKANIPVVLVGHFVGNTDTFASDQILVKHSNSYIAAHPGRVTAPNGSVR